MMKQGNALLTDGSALFYTSRLVGDNRPLNYRRLDERIKQDVGLESIDFSRFFTAFDPANEGQGKFLGFIEHDMGWEVEAVPVSEAVVTPPTFTTYQSNEPRAYIRFDAPIAFALGRLAGVYSKVVVIADSYALARPILQTIARGTLVTLVFFRQCVDPRWNKLLREISTASKRIARGTDRVDFLDLDKSVDELFGLGARLADVIGPGSSRLP
jgi:hypothetical protein